MSMDTWILEEQKMLQLLYKRDKNRTLTNIMKLNT